MCALAPCLFFSCTFPGQANTGSTLCSGRALSCPGCPGSSAGKACPLIPSPCVNGPPSGSLGQQSEMGGWVSSKVQRRDWCKCEEIGCMDERTKKSKNRGYKKARTGLGKGLQEAGRAGRALSPISWECSYSTPLSKLEGCSNMSKQDHKITLIWSWPRPRHDVPLISSVMSFLSALFLSEKMQHCLCKPLCVWQQALWDVILCYTWQ